MAQPPHRTCDGSRHSTRRGHANLPRRRCGRPRGRWRGGRNQTLGEQRADREPYDRDDHRPECALNLRGGFPLHEGAQDDAGAVSAYCVDSPSVRLGRVAGADVTVTTKARFARGHGAHEEKEFLRVLRASQCLRGYLVFVTGCTSASLPPAIHTESIVRVLRMLSSGLARRTTRSAQLPGSRGAAWRGPPISFGGQARRELFGPVERHLDLKWRTGRLQHQEVLAIGHHGKT